jgi:hypothetical protein
VKLAAAMCAAVAVTALAPAGRAEVIRFAVLVGHNRGQADEADLRYAEADALKMRDVLLDLGGFRHENVVLMQGPDAVAMRQTITALNERIRGLTGSAQVVLLVYYSGHADAENLHLGASRFSNRELEQLIGGSAADVRLLVVDSCRSGALTRSKGGRKGPSFAIRLDERLASQGAIFLTASAANEDAQESELLKGSFFTHYLVSGMLGAADQSGDGVVNLNEVYRYAYENTLRASSRTLAGTQHPSFRYALSGHGDLAMTWLRQHGDRRGWFTFPEGRSYLVLERDADGPVVAEVGLWDRRRTISVREGRYFIRARGREHLLEGVVPIAAGEHRPVQESDLDRIAYARLVRKGSGVLDEVHGVQFGTRLRSALANADGVSIGLVGGYAIDFASVSLAVRLNYQHSGFERGIGPSYIESDVEELGAELRLGKAWDTQWMAIEPFVTVGAGLMWQRFGTDRIAPSRTTGTVHVDAGAAMRRDLLGRAYFLLEGAVQTYWFRQATTDNDLSPSVGFAVTSGLGFWL